MNVSKLVASAVLTGFALAAPASPAQDSDQRQFLFLRSQQQQDHPDRPGQRFDGRLLQIEPGQVPNRFGLAWRPAADQELGLTLEPVPDRLRSHLQIRDGQGLVARVVEPDGAAARAGLRPNDILLSFGKYDLAKPEDLAARLKADNGEKSIELKILRGGKPVTLKVRRVVSVTLGPVEESAERTDYVLGVAISVPDETLRAQLDLPNDRGLLVDQVVKGSAAEKGGLKQNDVLISIAGKPLEGTDALIDQIREKKDNPTELRLIREGKELTLVVTPEKRTVKDRVVAGREPLRMWMFDQSAREGMRGPGGRPGVPGMPPMEGMGMRFRPLNPAEGDARVERLEDELKSLRESIEALKNALKQGKDRD